MRFFTAIFTFVGSVSMAQVPTPPNHEPKKFVDSTGTYFQQASLPVYLFVANSPNEVPVQLKSNTRDEIKMEGHGIHAFKHHNFVTNGYDVFEIHADGISPVTTIALEGAKTHQSDSKLFFGAGLTVSLKGTDEMSGVENIFYSLNESAFAPYKPIHFSDEGQQDIYYYAVDRTGNVETLKHNTFRIDLTAPTSYHNIVGISSQNVISTSSSIYLTTNDSLSGIFKVYYKFDKEPFRTYAGGNIPFQYLADGNHSLSYFATDNVGNKAEEKSVSFFLDKTAPIMSADVLGDKFIVAERVYFSGRTKLKLTAVDNKSGIKDVMYAVNESPYAKYEEPFYLPGRSGVHNVKFYAVDNTNNKVRDDFEHTMGVIYVDLTGPGLSHSYSGPLFVKADTVLVSPKTKIVLNASDPESGLKRITYSLADSIERPYTGAPFVAGKRGLNALNYFGYDNVNNRNSKSALFYLDAEGPKIQVQFAVSPNKEGKYPSYTNVYLSATDTEVGAGEIKFSINGAKESTYSSPIKGFVKNKKYSIRIKALDLLGNETTALVEFTTDRY